MANSKIAKIKLSDEMFLLIEVDENKPQLAGELAQTLVKDTPNNDKNILPKDAQHVSASSRLNDGAQLLYKQIEGLGALASHTIAAIAPAEVEIEAYIKFAGDVDIIPFLASAKGEGGLKLTLTWKAKE